MEQIRIHGRGGQGVVTAAELIAIAAFKEGLWAQAFPSFGVERTGAPIQSFVRLNSHPITTHEHIYVPTVLIIQDASLIKVADVFSGATENTLVLINANKNVWPELKKKFTHVYFCPATDIALKTLGKNIVNTVILGAFAHYSKLVSLNSLRAAIREKFTDKGAEIINKNIKAIELAFNHHAQKK